MTKADHTEAPIMVGQIYSRVKGPPLRCEVRTLDGDQAMCDLIGPRGSLGVRPVPLTLLHTDQFRLEAR